MMMSFRRRIAMKNTVFTHCLYALALGVAIAFTACNKIESEAPAPVDEGTITIEFQQVDPETNADGTTRTEFHGNTIWWSEGDKVRCFQYATVNGSKSCLTNNATLQSSAETISITVNNFNSPDPNTDSYYFSVLTEDKIQNNSYGK